MPKIIVTPRSLSKGGHPLLDRLSSAGYELVFPSPGAQPGETELISVASGAVGYIAGVEKIGAAFMEKATELRVISRNGTGVDNVDLEAAKARGIKVCRADGANARGVAELAFGHILSAARSIPQADAALKTGRWKREKGFELEGKTLGLIGCGKIGRLVARFAIAFDMRVLAYDPFPDPSYRPSPAFGYAGIEEVLKAADILSLHCPPLKDGSPVLGGAEMATLRKGVVVVNTARQGLVDERAMALALDSGTVRVYTMDAFDSEPPPDFTLVKRSSVLATPHIGGFTDESIDRATAVAVDNLLAALEDSGPC
ncbi:MAG: phosphoglycerate dehydrogenase [Rectinemataceae bacterium]